MASIGTVASEEKTPNLAVRLLGKIERGGVEISGIFIFLMMVLTTADVFLRYIFNSPIKGNLELQTMMMVAVVFFGLAWVQAKRGHIRMEVISSRLSGPNQEILNLLGDVLFLVIAIVITWQMSLQSWIAFKTGDYYFGLIKFPLWPAKSALFLGMGLVSLQLIAGIIQNKIWKFKKGVPRIRHTLFIIGIIAFFAVLFTLAMYLGSLELPNETIGWITIGIFFVLLMIGAPVAPSLALMGIFGFWQMLGWGAAMGAAATAPFEASANYTMTTLPLFMLLGAFADIAGFGKYGFEAAR
ncbi:MAG: TRAP transporter small permease, partial [Dehalococcoidales bacterium]|nr:TRAP transporter small permease [Dehalococcoidales bacterium]